MKGDLFQQISRACRCMDTAHTLIRGELLARPLLRTGLTLSKRPTDAIMLQSDDTLQQLIQSLWPRSTCTFLPAADGRKTRRAVKSHTEKGVEKKGQRAGECDSSV